MRSDLMCRYISNIFFIIIIFLLLIPDHISAIVPYSIEGELEKNVERELITLIKNYNNLNDELSNEIEEKLFDYGYFDVELTIGSDDKLIIKPGERYKIEKIKLSDLIEISPDRAFQLLDISEGEYYDREIVEICLERLQKFYLERGFLDTRISYGVFLFEGMDKTLEISISLDAGEDYYLRDLYIYGVRRIDEKELREDLGFREGQIMDIEEVKNSLIKIRKKYEEKGFSDVEVFLSDIETDGRAVDITISVNEGEQIVLRDVDITGNDKTRDYVILRSLEFRKGDIYQKQDIEKSIRNLNRLKIFRGSPAIDIERNGDVLIEVVEGRYVNIFGGLGYKPQDEISDGGLMGEIRGNLLNIAGTGRKLNFLLRAYGSDNISTSIRYYEPWIMGRDVFMNSRLEYEKRQKYRKIEVNAGLGSHPGGIMGIEIGGGFSIIKQESYNNSHEYLYTSQEVDTTDYSFNPNYGLKLNSREEFGVMRGNISDDRRKLEVKLEVDFEKFWGLHRYLTLYMRIMGKALFLEDSALYSSELFYLGGARDLRGYIEDAFVGERIALGTVEMRIPVNEETYLYGFYDGGYHYLREKRVIEGFNLGYGGGIALGTRIGIIRLDYGIGDGGITDGMIHISLDTYL
jgi:outer membrane protein assembly factor BamA